MIINPQSGSGSAFVFGELGEGTTTFPKPAKAVIVDYHVAAQTNMRGASLLFPGYSANTLEGSVKLSADGQTLTSEYTGNPPPGAGSQHVYFAILE
mgnify:CR=1 FL=1|jgi:hypothetical protein